MFSELQLKEIARELNVSPSAVRRLLGTISVTLPSLSSKQESTSCPVQLGLRLDALRQEGVFTPQRVVSLSTGLRDYRKCCPTVFGWIVHGGFDPSRSPESVSRGHLVHATRTAGRIRAQYLRGLLSR